MCDRQCALNHDAIQSAAVADILHEVQNSKMGYLTLTTPLSGKIFLAGWDEAVNGGAKCRK